MCHVSNTNPRCCKSDFSKAKEAPGDKYVSVGDTKIKIDFYEVDFFSKRVLVIYFITVV